MGFMSIVKKSKEKEKEMRLLVLGLDNAGKTTIIKKFNGEDINEISPTLGFNIKSLQYESYKLNVWDIGGQRTIRSYWRNYFEQTDGVIWVVDSSDKLRLEDTKEELHSLLRQEKLMGATLLVFCNKQDIPGSLTPEQIRDFLELDTVNTRHWGAIGCSARSGEGLLDGVDWIVKDIASRLFTYL
jgi:ADP-ribosylation factor-like protein 2